METALGPASSRASTEISTGRLSAVARKIAEPLMAIIAVPFFASRLAARRPFFGVSVLAVTARKYSHFLSSKAPMAACSALPRAAGPPMESSIS